LRGTSRPPTPLTYQSHQSGIETPNKKKNDYLDCIYQSHQSGIETCQLKGCRLTGVDYQSHQSGIETRTWSGSHAVSAVYQSHQSGIETHIHQGGDGTVNPTNRTNLELKHFKSVYDCSQICYQSHQSGIETAVSLRLRPAVPYYQSHQSGIETGHEPFPARNWRATNRTNLELKHNGF